MGPLPSMGWPSALTTRPISASPTGTDMMRPVRRTSSPSLISVIIAQQHRAHLVFFQVHGDAGHVVRELDQFAGHDLFQAVDAGDAVAHRDDRADFGDVDRAVVIFNLLAENAGNFVRSNLSHNIPFRLTFRAQAPLQRLQLAAHATVVNRGTDARHTPPISDSSTAKRIRMRFPVSRSSSALKAARCGSLSSRADETSARAKPSRSSMINSKLCRISVSEVMRR